jgi:hypothetical protein
MTFPKYSKLEVNQDIEKLREIAAVKTEIQTLENRVDFLNSILEDFPDLEFHVWQDANGKFIPIPDLEDAHLKNIVTFLKEKNKTIPGNISKEFLKRFGENKAFELTTNFTEDVILPF